MALVLHNEDVDRLMRVFRGQPPTEPEVIAELHITIAKLAEDQRRRIACYAAARNTGTVK